MNLYLNVENIGKLGFQLAAISICISCIYFVHVRSQMAKFQNKLFLLVLFNIFISAYADIIIMGLTNVGGTSKLFLYTRGVAQYVYFITHTLLSPLFCLYIAVVTGAFYRLKKRHHLLYEIPIIVSELFVITNPIWHTVYYFDGDVFMRGWGEQIIYLVATFYFMATVMMIFVFWNTINNKKRKVLTYSFFSMFLGIIIQLMFKEIHIELFMESLAATGIMVTIENEEGLKNTVTGIYNSVALKTDIEMFVATKREFSIVCVKMLNPQNIMQLVGPMNIDNLTKMTTDYLSTLVKPYNIYYSNPGTFTILNGLDVRKDHLEVSRLINERFKQEWDFQDRKCLFHAVVFCAEIPKDFKSTGEIMALIESAPMDEKRKKDDVMFGQDLDFFLRRSQVEKAMVSGLKNNRFEVYYQPVYDAKEMTIKFGEALIRLTDPKIGRIFPDEFLGMAERNGMIFEIGDFVLDEVCKFINSGIPVEMGVEALNINLSVIQCIQPSYAERIIQIVSRYAIEPRRIIFDIMEASTVTDMSGLMEFVRVLRNYGFRFSIDDYGVGYSNIYSMLSLNLDVVKVDKTILWEAEKSEVGRIIMESNVNMIKKMGKKILISGVESTKQIEIANEFGVDYLQGFFFSNPVSQNEFIGILRVTQLAKMEEQKVVAANEAMSNFLANMSHEIRTPINAVLGMDEMILRESQDEKIVEYAKTIAGAGKTLLSLINDILDFSKIEAGNMEIIEGEYELSDVIVDVINMVQLKAAEKGLTLRMNVDKTTPEKLYGDEMRLRQIMLNILNNAIKYTEKGSVTLQVSYERTELKRINLIISVRDTGIGIKEEDIGKLYKKFQRLDQNRNNTIEGSGLGLAIVNRLLELMNGKIDVESEYEKGSKFTITIPQVVVAKSNIGDINRKFNKKDEKYEKYTESFQAPEAEVLVVDDTKLNLVVFRELLKKTLVNIDEASSGMECIELIQKKKYDVVFLDYRMPIMDGIETLKKIKALEENPNKDTPIIALTANAISGARERFLKEGFDNYITKPVVGERLEEILLLYLSNDKIRKIGNEVNEGEKETSQWDEKPEEIYKDGIDKELGIQNCGSEDVFNVVLEAFRQDIPDKLENINNAYNKEDWKRYGTEVHAIKSSSRMIGAMKLSKLAESLENAADNDDIELIKEKNDELVDLYLGFMSDEEVKEIEVEDSSDKKEINEEIWKDACMTLKEFADNMDMDGMTMILESLDEYDLNDEQKKLKKNIAALSMKLEWDKIIDELGRYL